MDTLSLKGDPDTDRDKVSEPELLARIAAHGLWLASERQDGRRFDMPGANLIYGGFLQADLRHACLSGACLKNANMRESNFAAADLCDANLEGASMVNIDLADARLIKANLYRVVSPGGPSARA